MRPKRLLVLGLIVSLSAFLLTVYAFTRGTSKGGSASAVSNPTPPSGKATQSVQDSRAAAPPIASAGTAAQDTTPSTPAPTSVPNPTSPPRNSASSNSAGANFIRTTANEILQNKFPLLKFPGIATDFAFDHQTGQMGVTGAFENSLAVFDTNPWKADSRIEPHLIDVGGPAMSVAVKRLDDHRYWVVGVGVPARLVVIDAETSQVVKSCATNAGVPTKIATSQNAQDPQVVFFEGTDVRIPTRFNLRTMQAERRMGSGIVDIVLPPDGETLFFRSNSTDAGIGIHRARWGPATRTNRSGLDILAYRAGETNPLFLHPNGNTIASGRALFSLDLQTKLLTAAFEPRCFMVDQPWMAGFGKDKVIIGSINDGRKAVDIALPEGWLRRRTKSQANEEDTPAPMYAKMFADSVTHRFLVCSAEHLLAIPIDAFPLGSEVVLFSAHQFPKSATVGIPISIPLKFPTKPDRLALAERPDGASLRESAIVWTPRTDQIGEQTFVITSQSGGSARREVHTIDVSRASIDLPVSASGGLLLSADGRRALVLGDEIRVAGKTRQFQRMILIDVESGKILANQLFDEPFSAAVLGSDKVYLFTSTQILHLAIDTLEQLDKNENALAQFSEEIALFAVTVLPDSILDRMQDSANKHHVKIDARIFRDWVGGRTGFGRVASGILWNEATDQPQLILWPYEIRTTSWHDAHAPWPGAPDRIRLAVECWHPCVFEEQAKLSVSKNESVHHTSYSPDISAALAIVSTQKGCELAAFGLSSGSKLSSCPLMDADTYQQSRERLAMNPYIAIRTSGDRFVTLMRGKLYIGTLSELNAKREMPFYIEPEQSTMLLSFDNETKVQYSAEGATRFRLYSRELGTDQQWYEAESETGEFTISVSKSIHDQLDRFARQVLNLSLDPTLDNDQLVDLFLSLASGTFKQLVGRDPQGVPVPIRVFIVAENGKTSAPLAHDYLVEVPRGVFVAALDRINARGHDPWKRALRIITNAVNAADQARRSAQTGTDSAGTGTAPAGTGTAPAGAGPSTPSTPVPQQP